MSLAQNETTNACGDDQLLSESFDRRTLLDMEWRSTVHATACRRIREASQAALFLLPRSSSRAGGATTQDAITRAAMDAVEVLKKRLRKRFGSTD